jgi:hypothetical protein
MLMRNVLLAATAITLLGGVTAMNLFTHAGAQPVSQMANDPPPPIPDGPGRPGGWGTRPHPRAFMLHREAMERARTFSLLYRPADRHLTPADVQKIAEAFLLWSGNHTWKVVNVGQGTDDAINFSIAVPDGTVIASFAINSKTGQVTRTG